MSSSIELPELDPFVEDFPYIPTLLLPVQVRRRPLEVS